MKRAHQVKNLKRTRATVRKLEDAKQELEECYIKGQGKYIERKVEEIKNATESKQSRVAWADLGQDIWRGCRGARAMKQK